MNSQTPTRKSNVPHANVVVLRKSAFAPTQTQTQLFAWVLWRRTPAGKCLLDAKGSLRVRWFDAFKQAVGAGFKKLAKPREGGERNRIAAVLNMANGFPMHTSQLGQTLLRHVGFQPCLAGMLADQSQELLIRHAPQRKGFARLLTPRKHSIKNVAASFFILHSVASRFRRIEACGELVQFS